MPISGIDHVNILTDDLQATAGFYETLLGFRRAINPAIKAPVKGYWLLDDDGNAIIHLIDRTSVPERYAGHQPGGSTNAFHHVAMRATGFDETRARLDADGIVYRLNILDHIGLRQIFLADPNAVNLELNFSGD